MESAWSNGKMKVLKPRTSNENIPPMQIDSDERRGRYIQPSAMSPRFQPYAENIDAGSPLSRYLFAGSPLSGKVASASEAFSPPSFSAWSTKGLPYCGNSSGRSSSFGSRGRLSPSPLSSIENMEVASFMSPPMYRTAATGDDDVLVMDDILVRPMSGGKSGRSSSSSGRGSSSSSSASKSVFKTDICRAWEESASCRYTSKCQLHLKEEAQSGRPSPKSKSRAETSTSSSVRAGSSTHGPSSDIVEQQDAGAESDQQGATSQPTSPESANNWSPLDDGIEVVLPGSDEAPSREEIHAYISSLKHGRTAKRRLPVFEAIIKGT
ncbi:uncharacterized protein LOC108342539 [Vigna angularis]|uniref:uncharacterized protein LOC108342539 n=1 Tax=Phaseolus angularis TaxID=3914 RepID=UPI0022B58BCD|nr:uncharacterized protein LOC108342539 [Vigna angularis]XP_017435836.2 uncharacterized protein LOC108342539 [Vigna angularis]